MDIVTGVAADAISKYAVDPVIELLTDVMHKEENCQILQIDLKRMEKLLQDVSNIFQQRAVPKTVEDWLQKLENSIIEGMDILCCYDLPERRLDCLLCNPVIDLLMYNPVRLSKRIREWKEGFNNIYQGLQDDFSILVTAQKIAITALQKALPQDVPHYRFVGSGIKSAEQQVQTWLTETDHVRIIRVCGMAGVGKTSFLTVVYNHYIQVSSDAFQHVIWVTVSADYKTLDLQARIAKAINLDLPHDSDMDTQKRLLSARLKEKKFLLVLDDVWHPLDLQELGVAFGEGKQSKVLFSTRSKDLILGAMRADESIEIHPLSGDEAWMLFQRIAFKDRTVSVFEGIMEYAREIAEECKGLPLAITVIAASMIDKTGVDRWETCLNLMKTADPYFPVTHPRVDQLLYRRLRCSYDALPNSDVKNCFLYCAMYAEDEKIYVEELVQMWIAEGLVRSKQGSHVMDMAIGRNCVNLLLDRCLFQNATDQEFASVWDKQRIRVHDVIRDMAIYIGQEEENWVLKAGQQLSSFPEIHNHDCKRMSLRTSEIRNLPSEFTCPKLVSLFFSVSKIKEVPSGFLVSLTSLKVLDLSYNVGIRSLPSSVGQLKQLEFLNLSGLREIHDLPKEICHLSFLQFLNLSYCSSLRSLPSKIGELKTLKYLNLNYCRRLRVIPHEISHLTSLTTLDAKCFNFSAEAEGSEESIWSLKGLVNLAMLGIRVKVDVHKGMASSAIKVGIMGTWLEMRHLWLDFFGLGDDVLPEDMQKMSKLQSLGIQAYKELSLPDYICKFKHLEYLALYGCPHLREISSNGVWNESVLPKLRVLKIWQCPSLKRLPKGMEKLVSLRELKCEGSTWKDAELKSYLQNVAQREVDEEEEDNEEVEEEALS